MDEFLSFEDKVKVFTGFVLIGIPFCLFGLGLLVGWLICG